MLARKSTPENALFNLILEGQKLAWSYPAGGVPVQTLVYKGRENLVVLLEAIVTVQSQVADVLLGLRDSAALERVHFGDQVVKAAA